MRNLITDVAGVMVGHAEDAYAAHHAKLCDLIEWLADHAQDMPAPSDTTTWANVGDLEELTRLVTLAVTTMDEVLSPVD